MPYVIKENDIMLGLRYLNDLARKTGNAVSDLLTLRTKTLEDITEILFWQDILDIYATVRNRCVVVRNRQ